MAETDAAEKLVGLATSNPEFGIPVEVPWQAPIGQAVSAGALTVNQADAIRRGLGNVDQAVTGKKLGAAVQVLLEVAVTSGFNTDQLFKEARRIRNVLDADGITAREKQARDDEYWNVIRQPDGMVRLNALLSPENGEYVASVYDAITSPRRGGVRFVDSAQAAWAKKLQDDPRTTGQISVDGFITLIRNGADADPNLICGARKPAVRVIVTEKVLTEQIGHGYLEGNPTPVSLQTVERNLCDSGTIGVRFDDHGQCVNIGRDQRLFTQKQRIGLTIRDGGCRWPTCDRPPSWCEAHHIEHWKRDHGKTDIADGILLCQTHHMLLHNNGWEILRNSATYQLKPPGQAPGQDRGQGQGQGQGQERGRTPGRGQGQARGRAPGRGQERAPDQDAGQHPGSDQEQQVFDMPSKSTPMLNLYPAKQRKPAA
jgi:Domain of unknown function (DUF222)